MVTIKEISDLSGVSPTTVSNVLHGRTGKISKEKLERVQQVIQETHYVPNMAGRLLAKHGSRIIGVIMFYGHREESNAMESPFYGELFGALEARIRENGYFMLFYTVKNYEESMKVISGWDIEGLIVLHSPPDEIGNFIGNLEIPVVFIDSYLYQENSRFYNVGLDDFGGARAMGEFLTGNDKMRIAFFADEPELMGVDKERLNGLKEVQTIRSLDFFPIDHTEKIRHQQLLDFMENDLGHYDALFFASDFYAIDSMNLLQDKGIKVPEDISIVGFDNNLLSRQSRPKLTTVSQNVSEKGKIAIDILLKRIRGEEVAVKNLMLPVEIVVRDSVKLKDIRK